MAGSPVALLLASTTMPSSQPRPASRASSIVGHDADADQRDVGGVGFAAGADSFEPAVAFEGFDAGVEQQLHAGGAVDLFVEIGDRNRDRARHQPVHRFEHRHVDAALGGDGGDFQPDIAAADDGELLARSNTARSASTSAMPRR